MAPDTAQCLIWCAEQIYYLAVESAKGKYAQMLFNELFEDYSNALRPVEDTDKVLNVTLQITLSQIKDMVSKNTVLFFQKCAEVYQLLTCLK